jgi:hypothetical protein
MHSRFCILFRRFSSLPAVPFCAFIDVSHISEGSLFCAHAGVDVDTLWTRIRGLLLKALVCVQSAIRAHACAFELYGFDVMIDAATDSVSAAAVSSSHSSSSLSSASSSAPASSTVNLFDSNGLQSSGSGKGSAIGSSGSGSGNGSTSGSTSGTGGGGVRPWLIECNASPSMECDAPIDWQVFLTDSQIEPRSLFAAQNQMAISQINSHMKRLMKRLSPSPLLT